MSFLKKTAFITTIILLIFLIACGGSGNNNNPPPENNTPYVSISIAQSLSMFVGETKAFTVTRHNTDDFTLSVSPATGSGCIKSGNNAVTCTPTVVGTYSITVTATADTTRSTTTILTVNPSGNEKFTYNPYYFDWELAKKCALYSALAYDETRIIKNSSSNKPSKEEFDDLLSNYIPGDIQYFTGERNDFYSVVYVGAGYTFSSQPVVLHAHLKWEGFGAIDSGDNYGNDKEHDISYTLAYKEVNDSEILLVVILRGTDSYEWRGNMDIWKDQDTKTSRHYSFEQANLGMQKAINDYITTHALTNKSTNILITGHSRGAAVANLLTVDQKNKNWYKGNEKNVYAYTFATPNNTTDFTAGHGNIFNFVFDDDFVPQVPLERWEYGKNGNNYIARAENLYKSSKDFAPLVNRYIQLSEGRNPVFNYSATQRVLQEFLNIAPTAYNYYNTEPLLDMGLGHNPRRISLHRYMRNYIAEAAICGVTCPASWTLLLDSGKESAAVYEIANFFVEGAGMAPYINDTHQALTYYYALISGNDNFRIVDKPTDVPHIPENLTATAVSSTRIDLTWTESTSASYVTVYLIDHLDRWNAYTNSFSHTGLSPSTEYCYQVEAFNWLGSSGRSEQVCVTTPSGSTNPVDDVGPTNPLVNREYKTISAGDNISRAIGTDGSLWAWGYRTGVLVGDIIIDRNSNWLDADRNAPVKVMDSVASVCAGAEMIIKTDGSWWAWVGEVDALGDGTFLARSVPVKIMDSVASCSNGRSESMAIRTDGSLWVWKYGSEKSPNFTPEKIMDSVTSFSAGSGHTSVIRTDSSLWAWGSNNNGQLGDGTNTDRNAPVKIMDSVAFVSAGFYHTLAIKTDGSLWAWGSNYNGALGDGTNTNRRTPVKIMDGVTSVSAGYNYTMALKTDGSLWAWGWNLSGNLGDGTNASRMAPIKIMDSVTSVSAGYNYTMALKTDGSLWAWGYNGYGALGDRTNTDHNTPVKIMDGVMLPTVP